MIDTPQIIHTDAQITATVRLTIPREECGEMFGPAVSELMTAIAAQGIAPAGPVFSRHFQIPTEIFDFEIGVPVSAQVTSAGRVQAGELPAITVARTVYHGPYEGLGDGWGELKAWIAENQYQSATNLWESYLTVPEPDSDPATWRTELNWPIL